MEILKIMLYSMLPMLYILAIPLLFIIIKLYFVNIKFNKSDYKRASGNSFLKTAFNKGNYGEFLIFESLEKLDRGNRLLTNVYLPKEDGTTTEIDVLMIDKTGMYVFESKNYSGWIFGDENGKNWTQSLKGGKKSKFFNPIWQNKGHITALCNTLKDVEKSNVYSYIVFSERCELKKISLVSTNIKVLKRNQLIKNLKSDLDVKNEILSDEKISHYYEQLERYTLVDNVVREKHISDIKEKMSK